MYNFVVKIETYLKRMKRYGLKEMIMTAHDEPVAVYKDQIAVITVSMHKVEQSRELFAIDAFAIGYTLQGYCIVEFNNDRHRLERGKVYILAPTHSCRVIESSPDFKMRVLILNSDGYNLSVHLNYIIKSERWMQTYFNPVIRLNDDETRIMHACVERIVEQINRTDTPNQASFLRLATTWHHVELDNIMQVHSSEITDNNKPLTRQQSLARQLYRLIVNNFRKEHHAKFYSDQMCLTPQYLNQITNNAFGKTLNEIISGLLFSTARTMILSSEMSLQEIADELGFADLSTFSKFIKKISGMSPNNMRKINPHKAI